MDSAATVTLARGMRLQWEPAQGSRVLLYPEGMVQLNQSAGEILALCDGRTVDGVIRELAERFPDADVSDDVLEFLADAQGKGWIQVEGVPHEC